MLIYLTALSLMSCAGSIRREQVRLCVDLEDLRADADYRLYDGDPPPDTVHDPHETCAPFGWISCDVRDLLQCQIDREEEIWAAWDIYDETGVETPVSDAGFCREQYPYDYADPCWAGEEVGQ